MADATEHPTRDGKVSLAVVIDAWNREVVGWSIADHLRAELVCDAFDMPAGGADPNPAQAGRVVHLWGRGRGG